MWSLGRNFKCEGQTIMPGKSQSKAQTSKRKDSNKVSTQTIPGEPGRTPGSAEGDRETVEQSLRDKEKKGDAGTAGRK
jgi:hypothetical protein